ncbi:hypothetical protein AB1F87_001200 [Vibrio mimicus]
MNFNVETIHMKLLLRLIVINLILYPPLTFGRTITASNDHHCHEYLYNGDKDRIVKSCYSENNLFTVDDNDKSRSGYLTITYLGKGDISVDVEISNDLGRKAIVNSDDLGVYNEEILYGSTSDFKFKFREDDRGDNAQTLFINGKKMGGYSNDIGFIRIKLGDGHEISTKYRDVSSSESFCRVSVIDAVGDMMFLQGGDVSGYNSASVQYDTNVNSDIGFKVDKVRFISGWRANFKDKAKASEKIIKIKTNEVYRNINSLGYEKMNVSDRISVSGSGVISFVPFVNVDNVNNNELLAGRYVMKATVTCD